MMILSLLAPHEVAQTLATRLRGRRLARTWTQEELSRRSAVPLATLRRFERTGRISLQQLLQIVSALGLTDDLAGLFQEPLPRTLAEVDLRARTSTRRRGRSSRPATPEV